MRDKDWELLYALYKTPNITKAASKMYMTQPTLTKRLQAMEAEFGLKIVDRSTKGVSFTPEGEFLAKRAERYMRFMEDLYQDLKEFQEQMDRKLVIGSSYTFSKYRLPDLLFRYFQVNPSVKFSIVNEPSDTLYQKLIDGSIDAAFVRNDFDGPVVRVLLETSQGYLVSRENVRIEDLDKIPFISYRSNSKTKELLTRWWRGYHTSEQIVGVNVGYIDFVWEFLDKAPGYTLCFDPMYPEDRYNFYKTPIYYRDGAPVLRNTWFLYRSEEEVKGILGEFIRFVRTYAEKEK